MRDSLLGASPLRAWAGHRVFCGFCGGQRTEGCDEDYLEGSRRHDFHRGPEHLQSGEGPASFLRSRAGFRLVPGGIADCECLDFSAGKYINSGTAPPEALVRTTDWGVSFVVITVLFAFIFKVLPRVPLHWGDVTIGAVVTSLLFTAGKFLLGVYFGKAGFTDTYGAAGSLVIALVWVYYSAQVLFLGAEFLRAFAHRWVQCPAPYNEHLGSEPQGLLSDHDQGFAEESSANIIYAHSVRPTSRLSGRWIRPLDASFGTIPGDRPKLPGRPSPTLR